MHMTVNGEDMPYHEFMVFITADGDTSCSEYISFSNGKDDNSIDLSFDWDDDEAITFDDSDEATSFGNN